MTDRKPLYAHVLLDRSGSMEQCRDRTIDAFNEYVASLATNADVDAAVSLSLFDSESLDLVIDGKPAGDVPKLTRETYVPRGMTPLNDAIGKTVTRIDGEWHRPGEGIALVILTDGLENCSREYTLDAVKALLADRQKDKNWLVIYLGANQDAFAQGVVTRGTAVHNTMNFAPANISASMSAAARATGVYGMTGNAGLAGFTDAERAEAVAKKPDKPRASAAKQ